MGNEMLFIVVGINAIEDDVVVFEVEVKTAVVCWYVVEE